MHNEQKSTYSHQLELKPDIKTAIIYSLDDLVGYMVEIKNQNTSYYISKNNEPLQYGNMADARQAAISEGAEEAYLALSKTYEENDLSTCHAGHSERYDYNRITL